MNGANPQVIADETHNSMLWGCALLLPLVGLIPVLTSVPAQGIRILLGLVTLVLVGASVMAMSGFHYIFTPAGLEVRTLGFKLRSLAPADIREYSAGDWNIARGYGIRGLGDRQAYVWGNRGVRIKTTRGEIFLGHRDPQRIIRDLDSIKQFAR